MSQQAARLPGDECRNCGGSTERWVAQHIDKDQLAWADDWRCPVCHIQSCDGGRGPAPEWVRRELLTQHGPGRLVLTDPGARGGGVLKAFRSVFGLSVREAHAAATQLRDGGYVATHVEVCLLADLLERDGIAAEARLG